MKIPATIALLFCFTRCYSQSVTEAAIRYQQHKYPEALEMARQMIAAKTDIAAAFGLAGRIYIDTRQYDSGIACLQTAIQLDTARTYISAWSYAYLGAAHLITGERQKGIDELNEAIRLHITDNSVKYAESVLNATAPEPHWLVVVGRQITYFFQDNTLDAKARQYFIDTHEAAYEKIDQVFHAALPRKMVFYVWYDAGYANRVLHHELGFTDPETCTTNTLVTQSIGHEMTHTLAYWGWGMKTEHVERLINEGVAVAFDQNQNDKYQQARQAIADGDARDLHSVLDIWRDSRKYASVLYPVGGALLTYLYAKSSSSQFESLIKDQRIDNAEKTYGVKRFYNMISEFDKMVGLK